MQEDACGIVNMLQELRSAKFLTLNLDIVECISSFPDLLSGQSSPFSNLIRLKVECGTRDTSKFKLTTEARTFLLDNSPTATFIVKGQPPREAMKEEKGVKEQIKAGIEDVLKQLQASLDYENILIEKKVAIKNLLDDIQEKVTKKKDEIVVGLMLEFTYSMADINEMFRQASNDLKPLVPKMKQIQCLMCSLPQRHREQMGAHSSQFDQIVTQGKALIARQAEHKDFVTKIVHDFKASTSEYHSSSSSSTAIELPTEAMKEKEVKVEIEDILKDLQASIEQENILNQKKVGIEKLLDDILKIGTNKKDTQIESESKSKSKSERGGGQIEEEMVAKLLTQFSEKLVDYTDMFRKVDNDLKPLSLKIEQASCLLCSMPKQQMISRYFIQIVQIVAKAKALTARIDSHKDFVNAIADTFVDSDNKVSSTSEQEHVPSTTHKHPLSSQTTSSSSSTRIVPPTPSTSSINPMP
ncbi:uncharacterized protein [Rutidosis leptorrhynchoides]|uniref:uncharacterized protein n=1 Tax=Rutidosis leptorrhynchoides TaxID=125765 RepID=UPI003A998D4F